jgi:ABC-type glycerol-3-phosphate transport system permease component
MTLIESRAWRGVVIQLLLVMASIVVLVPFASAFATSLQGGGLRNYLDVISVPQFYRFVLNSMIVSALVIVGVLVTTIMAAYAFSKLHFPGRTALLHAILLGLFVPGIVLLVPVFFYMRTAGLINTLWAVIIPKTAFLLPSSIFITKNYLDSLSNDVIDAAMVDGCNTFQILRHVVVPLSGPILSVVAVFSFLSSWNEYFLGLVFLQRADLQLVTQVPPYFLQFFFLDVGHVFAALILISVPVVAVYASLRRKIETGLVAGIGK